jgi:hypothetical protein
MGGFSFLTPLDALFALAAALPLAALLANQRRSRAIRHALDLPKPRRGTISVVVALVVLVSLVAVAAAQPVVIRTELVNERADAQAFFVFDTSLSMAASSGPGEPTRLARAKHLALRLRSKLHDLPIGIASMTDRTLPNLMPTTDPSLFMRTLDQSVAIDSPPPSQTYRGRATTFMALAPIVESHFFSSEVQRRLLVVFTDGEAQPVSPLLAPTLHREVTPLFVHVWQPGERIYRPGGSPDPRYTADPSSAAALVSLARTLGGSAFTESQLREITHTARNEIGFASTHTVVSAYARHALAPWFIFAGAVPLAFLLWRRNA